MPYCQGEHESRKANEAKTDNRLERKLRAALSSSYIICCVERQCGEEEWKKRKNGDTPLGAVVPATMVKASGSLAIITNQILLVKANAYGCEAVRQ